MYALRPYQQQAADAIEAGWQDAQKQLLVLPTGTGKTIVFSDVTKTACDRGERVLMLAHRDELVRQAVDKLSASTGIMAAVEKASETALDSLACATVGSVQTLMHQRRLEQFTPDHYQTIIVDEAHHCHPAGTMIDGRPIESIKEWDTVESYNHKTGCMEPAFVKAVMRRPVSTICEITFNDGRTLIITPDHPVWAGKEYLAPTMLLPYHTMYEKEIPHQTQDVCDMRDGVCSEVMELQNDAVLYEEVRDRRHGEEEKACRGHLPVVRQDIHLPREKTVSSSDRPHVLQQDVLSCIQRKPRICSHGEDQQEVRIGQDEGEQPNAQPGDEGQDDSVHAWTHLSRTWRERQVVKATSRVGRTAQAVSTFVSHLFHGVCHPHSSSSRSVREPTQPLQDRHRNTRGQVIDRGGRENSSPEEVEVSGPPQNRGLECVGVARVEIHKRGSGSRFEELCPEGVVYNIEVEGNHNYFANNFLVHNCLADSYLRIFDYFDKAKVLGVTATPDRGDKRNLGEFFESIAYEYSIRDAIKDGYLCPIEAQTIPIDIDLTDVHSQAGDFAAAELGNALDPYLEQIADSIVEHARDRKILIFLPLIQTSMKMNDLLLERGIRSYHVDGTSPDRKEILSSFTEDFTRCICNSMLLTEGYDEPSIDTVVVLRPTRSRSLYAQMVGRGTRPLPGKTLLLLDFLWHHERHKLCKPAHLIAESERIEEKMESMQDQAGRAMNIMDMDEEASKLVEAELIKEAASGAHEREQNLMRYLIENKNKDPKKIDPVWFATSTHNAALLDYQPTMARDKQPATERQMACLEKNGFDADGITFGYASAIISGIVERNGMATPKMVRVLERNGHPNAAQYTFDQARAYMDALSKKWNRMKQWKGKRR